MRSNSLCAFTSLFFAHICRSLRKTGFEWRLACRHLISRRRKEMGSDGTLLVDPFDRCEGLPGLNVMPIAVPLARLVAKQLADLAKRHLVAEDDVNGIGALVVECEEAPVPVLFLVDAAACERAVRLPEPVDRSQQDADSDCNVPEFHRYYSFTTYSQIATCRAVSGRLRKSFATAPAVASSMSLTSSMGLRALRMT